MTGTILIVDDDRAMTTVLKTGLKQRGFACETCASAEDALARLEEKTFDAILTDWNLSGADGLELCRQVRVRRPELPVLVMSAFADPVAAVEAKQAGAYDFVSKPIELDLLEIAFERAVEHRRLVSENESLRRKLESEG